MARRILAILAVVAAAVVLVYAVSTFMAPRLAPIPAEPKILFNREIIDNLAGSRGSKTLFRIEVPKDASDLHFILLGGKGTADLYASLGNPPALDSFDAKDAGESKDKVILIPQPKAGTYYVQLLGAHGNYSDHVLIASYAPRGSTFKVGMHAHRLYNGGDWDGPESDAPKFKYGVIRDWDISHLHDAAVWRSDNTIDFRRIEKVYDGHAKNGAKVIKTFGTVPTWVSKRPAEPNKQYPDWPGAKSGPRSLDQY